MTIGIVITVAMALFAIYQSLAKWALADACRILKAALASNITDLDTLRTRAETMQNLFRRALDATMREDVNELAIIMATLDDVTYTVRSDVSVSRRIR